MKPFAERLREDRRLLLLRLLSEQNGMRSNASILHAAMHALNVPASRADVAEDIQYLAAQNLLLADTEAGMVLVKLLPHGHDVVCGDAHVPGVSRPGT